MAKLGGKYETIFVVDSTLTDEATAAIVESAVWPIPSTTRTRVITS